MDTDTIDLSVRQLRTVLKALQGIDPSLIKRLILSQNYLKSIEKVIGYCTSLIDLDLSINLITRIENLDTLSSLTQLILSNNRIEEISGLESLQSLKVLVLV